MYCIDFIMKVRCHEFRCVSLCDWRDAAHSAFPVWSPFNAQRRRENMNPMNQDWHLTPRLKHLQRRIAGRSQMWSLETIKGPCTGSRIPEHGQVCCLVVSCDTFSRQLKPHHISKWHFIWENIILTNHHRNYRKMLKVELYQSHLWE